MSRTLSGLFLVGALNRPRKRKGTNRENPRTIPEQIGKIPGKVPKKDKKGRTSPDRETPPFETPPFSGPWIYRISDGPTTTTTIFEFISRGPIFHFWGTPWWGTDCPFYTVEHRETTKMFHLMCHQMPFWCGIRCKTFWEKLWLWLCLGRPWQKLVGEFFLIFFCGKLLQEIWRESAGCRGTHKIKA